MSNGLDKKATILELREKDIINSYGVLQYDKLIQEYGAEKTRKIYDNITQKDIYKTYNTEELYTIAIEIVQDIRIRLMEKNVLMDDIVDLKSVVYEIRRQEAESWLSSQT